MFLIELALTVGRLDWLQIAEELSPYELAVIYTFLKIKPQGAERDDLRAAMLATVQAQSNSPKLLSQEARKGIFDLMTGYLDDSSEAEVSPDEAARQAKAAFASIGKA